MARVADALSPRLLVLLYKPEYLAMTITMPNSAGEKCIPCNEQAQIAGWLVKLDYVLGSGIRR